MILKRNEQIAEIIKCGKDPIYFAQSYAKIQHPQRGAIPFETYPFQDDCFHDFAKHRFNIVLKSRQLGLSTVCAAYAVWLSIFHKDKNILVIATKLSTAVNFVSKVKFILQSLPPWLLFSKYTASRQEVKFNNGSQIKAIPTSDDAGRSEALSLLIVDEAAFIRNFEDIWTGLYPTISTGGRAIIISTPNGVGGQYYKLWTDAVANVNDFNTTKLPWDVHPEHDDDWFQNETKGFSKRKIAQEFLCDFNASGDTFLQPDVLDKIKQMVRSPKSRDGFDNNIWIWSDPIPDRRYVISADVARGDARDYSTFHIIDAEDCSVSAEYMGKVPPEKLATMMDEWGRKYNNALACPENNTFGWFVCSKLKDNGYPRMYYSTCRGDPFTYTPTSEDEKPGFLTNQKMRTQILTKLEELLRTGILKVESQRLVDQLQAFIWNGAKPMASRDSYDDLIMSLAIGCWLIEGNSGVSATASAMAEAMLRASSVSKREPHNLPGGIQSHRDFVVAGAMGISPQHSLKPRSHTQIKHADVSDFSWLFR